MKKLLTCIALGFATTSYAVTPLWMRDVQISPDGTEIAFCYKGDIYKVPAKGGTATQLTTQASYECTPIWSPDGKQIAFASDRNGNFDLFVMPSNGGTAQCLTTHSASEIPSAFTPDGKYVLFSASIQDPAQSALFPTSAMTELYKVPIGGGRTEQVLGTPAEMVCFDKSGKTFLYQDRKGFEDEWRKHHTSSVTRDIWMYDTQTGKHTNLTDHAGEDRNAVFTPDGQTVYFLSERNGGSFNVYSFPLNTPQSITAVTKFKTHPVRFLSTSSDNTLCYTYDGEIYTQRPGSNPQKVRIDLIRDDQEQITDLNSSKGATSATVSPDFARAKRDKSTESDVKRIFEVISARFDKVTVFVEVMNPMVVKSFKEKSIEGSHAKFTWGIKNGKALAELLSGFTFTEEHSLTEGMAEFVPIYHLLDKIPVVRNISNKIIVLDRS